MSQEKKVIKIVEIRGEKYDAFEYGNTCCDCCFYGGGGCPSSANDASLICIGSNNGGIEVYYQPHTETNSAPTEATVAVKDVLLYISRTHDDTISEEDFLSEIAAIKYDIALLEKKELIRSKLTQEEIDYIRANGV